MLKLIKHIGFLILVISAFVANAQEFDFQFDHLSSEINRVEKGLSQNSVLSILQDSKGFLWFGTWDGLNKYDGYSFSSWSESISDDVSRISNTTIHAIYEDEKGNLWLGTEGGLNKYDRKRNLFTCYSIKSKGSKICSDTVKDIVGDKYGNLWIATNNGLDKFIVNQEKFVHYNHQENNLFSLSSNKVNCLWIDNSGNLWIGTNNGLSFKDKNGENIIKYTTKDGLVSNEINDIVQDKYGIFWVGTPKGLNRIDVKNEEIKNFVHDPLQIKNTLSSDDISCLFVDKDGQIWIGTNGGGLNKLDPKTHEIKSFRHNVNELESISNDYISTIYQDKSGIIWIGTRWSGVNKLVKNKKKFYHFSRMPNRPNTLSNNVVWGFFEDKNGDILISTDGGVNTFERNTLLFFSQESIPNSDKTPASDQVRRVFVDSKGNKWVGTHDKGLSKYNPKTKKYTHYTYNPKDTNSLSSNTVWSVIEDKRGDIIIGTFAGINIYNPIKNNFSHLKHKASNPNSLSHDFIYCLTEEKDGTIWIGTNDGLNKYDIKNKKNVIFKHNPQDKYSISNNRIFSVYQDTKKNIWIGTLGGGVNCYDPKTNKFVHYTKSDGLANNIVYDILEDNNGHLWMSTNFGLSMFNPKTKKFVNFDVKDGIQSYEFNSGAAIKTKDGKLLFGGMNGFNIFDPDEIEENENKPNIVITDFKIFNQSQHREYFNNDTIRLKYDQNFFMFDFSAMDYVNPAKNKYQFILEHLDKDWVFTDADKRSADYTDVKPGIYRFKVKASNSDGIWNENGIAIVIIIEPAWYQTILFKIISICIVAFITWFLIFSRIKQIKKKHFIEKKMLEIEKQLFDLEQQALRLQMNPHFIFNSLNSIQSFVINNDTDKAIRYLSKFAQLMRMILSHSREAYIAIKEEMKSLSYYMDIEKLRFDNKFEYEIFIDPDIDTEFIAIPPMIIQPYVENAILHGIMHRKEKGLIKVSLKILNEDTVLCVVEDNGVGRKKAMEIKNSSGIHHRSRGMSITKERLEILNKQNNNQISINVIDLMCDGVPCGTKVEILIPISEF